MIRVAAFAVALISGIAARPFDQVPLWLPARPPDAVDVPLRHNGPSSPEKKKAMAELLDKYAPVFKLASTERYYPSSVPFMLQHYDFVRVFGFASTLIQEIQFNNGTTYHHDGDTFTPEGIAKLPERGKHQLLSVTPGHNPQPLLDDPESYFLYGPAGQPGAMIYDEDGRGRVTDDVYGFWVDQGRGVVDLWYWTFYPYNLGKEVGYLGWLGNHVTDWEHLRVRTVNGTALSADFNTHSGGAFSAGTYRWSDIERFGDRPAAYVASGSHGVWPTPGKHVYAQLLNLWQLVDMTDDEGAIWDTQGHVVPIEWWTGPNSAQPLNHTGDYAWLQYKGKYGNKGDANCWWHPMVGICQVVDGPIGPNRWFGLPPDCIIGETAEEVSSYSFYLSRDVVQQARDLSVTTVVVEQVCARPEVASANIDWNTLKKDEIEIWTVPGSHIPFRGVAQHHATVEACRGGRSAAKAYRLALYDNAGERVSTSNIRVICMYTEGKSGWVISSGARINDVDEWRWSLSDVNPEPQPKPEPPSPTHDVVGAGPILF